MGDRISNYGKGVVAARNKMLILDTIGTSRFPRSSFSHRTLELLEQNVYDCVEILHQEEPVVDC